MKISRKLCVYARGVNFHGQLGIQNKNKNLQQFEKLTEFQDRKVSQIDGHFTQSLALLDDGQVLQWGWILDQLTSTRTLSWYKKFPKTCSTWQSFSLLGSTLGMRSFYDRPNLMNKDLMQITGIKKVVLGGSFILALDYNGQVYGMGDNYKGQLGTSDSIYQHQMIKIETGSSSKIVDISAGFSHSLYLNDQGTCFGSGKVNWDQYIPLKTFSNQDKTLEFYSQCQKIDLNKKIKQISSGFHHSLYLTTDNKLYASGMNNHGQCGKSNIQSLQVDQHHEVFCDFENNEYIQQISAGKSHNIILTNLNKIYVFGATFHHQLGKIREFDIDACNPQEVYIPLSNQNEKIIKVKAGFDRCCVITNLGQCYIWGGEDFTKIGGENYQAITNLNHEIGLDVQIQDVGLGYLHTLVITDP